MSDPHDGGSGGSFTPCSSLARTPPPEKASTAKRPLPSPGESQPAPTRPRVRSQAPAANTTKRAVPSTSGAVVPVPAVPVTPKPTVASDAQEEPVEEIQVSKASKLELLDSVRGALHKITGIVSGPGSRLNKTDVGHVYGYTQDVLAVVAALELQLSEAERRADLAEAKLASGLVQTSVQTARADAAPVSFANALKTGKGSAPRPLKANAGPVLAFYPKEEAESNTSEATKAELQRTINPAAISAQIGKVRKVGNAGVVVHTASAASAERLKMAVPLSLRVVEPKKRRPLVALHNVDGDPSFDDLVSRVFENTFEGKIAGWSLSDVQGSMKGLFKKSKRNSQFQETTVVFECSPRMRETLVNRGSVHVGWQEVEVYDYIDATCCNKCQLYGHPEKFCRAKEVTCARCGETGHRSAKCQATFPCCATCKRFKRNDAHRTKSPECPARKYAEEQRIS